MSKLDLRPSGFRPQREKWVPSLQTIQLGDNLLCFYDGRTKAGEPVFHDTDRNWPQVDMNLGVCCYVLFKDDEAVVFDTMVVPEQAQYVRDRMEALGVKKFTVVISHIDLDHNGGNAVFADSEIISQTGTYNVLAENKDRIENGERWGTEDRYWGPPPIKPFVLPNSTIDKDTRRTLAGFEMILVHTKAHQDGGNLCVYIPEYKAMIVGDAAEDSTVYVGEANILLTSIEETKRLLEFDVEYVFPAHGDPVKIARGAYDKRLIEAAVAYQERLYQRRNEPGYLESELVDFMADYIKAGVITPFEPYHALHKINTRFVYDYWVTGKNCLTVCRPIY